MTVRGDPYSKVKRRFISVLKGQLDKHGFVQWKTTVYFYRDRGDIRQVMFFQKVRSMSVAIAYGLSARPNGDDWQPEIETARWLKNQELYDCRYVQRADGTAMKVMEDFAAEALPWFESV
jgi:hypothetical protein